MYAAKQGRYTLCVLPDNDAESPRQYGNIGRMICFHKRYSLGDKHCYNSPLDFLRDAYAAKGERPAMLELLTVTDLFTLIDDQRDCVLLPLYLYDHSGITMSTTGFSCPWDSGQVGWIYAGPEAIREAYGSNDRKAVERAKRALLTEVEIYDAYLRGECYGYRLYVDGEEDDACWGLIGEPESVRDYLPDEAKALADKLEWTDESESAYLSA